MVKKKLQHQSMALIKPQHLRTVEGGMLRYVQPSLFSTTFVASEGVGSNMLIGTTFIASGGARGATAMKTIRPHNADSRWQQS